MRVLFIFLVGLGILLGAIVLNLIAANVGLKTWYEFLQGPKNTSVISYIWLLIVYPFFLGVIGWYLTRLFSQ